jgi:hypothetical protein
VLLAPHALLTLLALCLAYLPQISAHPLTPNSTTANTGNTADDVTLSIPPADTFVGCDTDEDCLKRMSHDGFPPPVPARRVPARRVPAPSGSSRDN